MHGCMAITDTPIDGSHHFNNRGEHSESTACEGTGVQCKNCAQHVGLGLVRRVRARVRTFFDG